MPDIIKSDVNLTITRRNVDDMHGDVKSMMYMKIQDVKSRRHIIEVEISPEDLMVALTSVSNQKGIGFLYESNIKDFGKKKISKSFTIDLPCKPSSYDKTVFIEPLEKACPEGWEISTYLGSKD